MQAILLASSLMKRISATLATQLGNLRLFQAITTPLTPLPSCSPMPRSQDSDCRSQFALTLGTESRWATVAGVPESVLHCHPCLLPLPAWQMVTQSCQLGH